MKKDVIVFLIVCLSIDIARKMVRDCSMKTLSELRWEIVFLAYQIFLVISD